MSLPDRWLSTSTDRLLADGVIEIGDGYRAKNAEFASEGLPFARVQNIRSGFDFRNVDLYPEEALYRVGQKVSRSGDSVITTKGSVGRVAYVTDATPRFVYSPQLSYWRSLDHDVVRPRYLFYWLQGPEFLEQCGQMKGSTDMADYLNLRDQRRLSITLPNTEEQDRIVRVLSAYDELIENNTRRIQILEEMAQAIYREWFVEFRYPGHENVPLVDSGLGPTPQGWAVTELGKVAASLIDGDWIETKDQGGSDYRLLQVGNVAVGSFRETGKYRYVTAETFERLRCTAINPGDILIARMPDPIGRAWLVDHLPEPAITAVDVAILKPPSNEVASYLIHWLNSTETLARCEAVATGTTRKRVSRSVLARFQLRLPPADLLSEFHRLFSPAFEQIRVLRRSAHFLAEARDLLLPRLIAGGIDVSDLDIDVGDAAA